MQPTGMDWDPKGGLGSGAGKEGGGGNVRTSPAGTNGICAVIRELIYQPLIELGKFNCWPSAAREEFDLGQLSKQYLHGLWGGGGARAVPALPGSVGTRHHPRDVAPCAWKNCSSLPKNLLFSIYLGVWVAGSNPGGVWPHEPQELHYSGGGGAEAKPKVTP